MSAGVLALALICGLLGLFILFMDRGAMMDDDWTMADGFAPVSRLHYCQHPRACSAPSTGRCARCQTPPRVRKFQRQRLGSPTLNEASVPSYLDPEFDDLSG